MKRKEETDIEKERARGERLRETKLGEKKEREMSLQRDKETHANGQSTMMQLQPPVRSSNDWKKHGARESLRAEEGEATL